MERVEFTEGRWYSGIYFELCGLWNDLKVQRAVCIVLYRVNCVVYVSRCRYKEQGG